MSKLRPDAPSGTPAPPPAPRRSGELVAGLLEGEVLVDVDVPRTSIAGKMRLLRRREARQVRVDCRTALAAIGLASLTPGIVESYTEWDDENVTRTLAIAMRDPDDVEQPLASLEDWEGCDDEQLAALWARYTDLEAELDPLGERAPPLSEPEEAALRAAAKKADAPALRSFGSRRLALFAITLAATPPT